MEADYKRGDGVTVARIKIETVHVDDARHVTQGEGGAAVYL